MPPPPEPPAEPSNGPKAKPRRVVPAGSRSSPAVLPPGTATKGAQLRRSSSEAETKRNRVLSELQQDLAEQDKVIEMLRTELKYRGMCDDEIDKRLDERMFTTERAVGSSRELLQREMKELRRKERIAAAKMEEARAIASREKQVAKQAKSLARTAIETTRRARDGEDALGQRAAFLALERLLPRQDLSATAHAIERALARDEEHEEACAVEVDCDGRFKAGGRPGSAPGHVSVARGSGLLTGVDVLRAAIPLEELRLVRQGLENMVLHVSTPGVAHTPLLHHGHDKGNAPQNPTNGCASPHKPPSATEAAQELVKEQLLSETHQLRTQLQEATEALAKEKLRAEELETLLSVAKEQAKRAVLDESLVLSADESEQHLQRMPEEIPTEVSSQRRLGESKSQQVENAAVANASKPSGTTMERRRKTAVQTKQLGASPPLREDKALAPRSLNRMLSSN